MKTQTYCAALAVAASACLASVNAATSVNVIDVAKRPMERSSKQPAEVTAYHVADLNAKITGYVADVSVDIGQQVSAGQTLFTIEAPEFFHRVAALQGSVEQSAQSERSASAVLAAVQSESLRIAKLVSAGSLNQKAGDEAAERLASAQANVAAAKAAHISAKAELAEAKALLDYTTIKAPFDGIVASRSVDPGDLVYSATSNKGSATPLMQIAQTNKLRLVTYLPENDALWLDVGDPAILSFNAIPGKTFTGAVSRHSAFLDPKTRKVRAEIDIDNRNGALMPGLFGEVEITLETQQAAIVVPAGSVRFDGAPHVYVLENGNTIRKTEVALGLDNGIWLEITQGLTGNEQIVSSLIGRLQDGETVVVR